MLRWKMASGPFTIFQLARAAGLTIDDVRFYRDSGLLQPPRRRPSRSGDMAFYDEHVERLHLIRGALRCGLTHADIAEIVDPSATCAVVSAVAKRRLEAMRAAGEAEAREATCLAGVHEACRPLGAGKDCSMLKTLSIPGR